MQEARRPYWDRTVWTSMTSGSAACTSSVVGEEEARFVVKDVARVTLDCVESNCLPGALILTRGRGTRPRDAAHAAGRARAVPRRRPARHRAGRPRGPRDPGLDPGRCLLRPTRTTKRPPSGGARPSAEATAARVTRRERESGSAGKATSVKRGG